MFISQLNRCLCTVGKDAQLQDHLHRQEQERAEAEEEGREKRKCTLPPQRNRFRVYTYESSTSVSTNLATCCRQSSSFVKPTRSATRNAQNIILVSRCPAISSGSQSRTKELASTSTRLRRAISPLAPCYYFFQVKNSLHHITNIDLSEPICSNLPLLQYQASPSPDDPEPNPGLPNISDPFEKSSESSRSVIEDRSREDSLTPWPDVSSRNSATCCQLTVPESLLAVSSSTMSSPENCSFSLMNHMSFSGCLSNHVRTMDILSSESESDWDDDGRSRQDELPVIERHYNPVQSQSSSRSIVCPSLSVRANQSVRGQLSTLNMSSTDARPEESSRSRASNTAAEGHSPMPSLVGRESTVQGSMSVSATHGINRRTPAYPQWLNKHLTELDNLSSGRADTTQPGSVRLLGDLPSRSGPAQRHSPPVDQEEAEVRGPTDSRGSTEDTSHSETPGLMGHLTEALMTLRNLRRVVTQICMSNIELGIRVVAAHETLSAPSTDPETLRRIKESLLAESSDEEEGDRCRICHSGTVSPTDLLLSPCQCSGSLQYIHHNCLKKWIRAKIQSGTMWSAAKTCELCTGSLTLDFDLDEFGVEQTNPDG
ncbi:hypothetical protein DPEC_G00359310 [Dallia pectoralis]|uniref:Uncharacterized protein n=1 Tax=Dallia pectoralis TaxID=75939 RepID=A0ACC2F0Q8_DALPE|nr:hypothetical protein DPEC_G00359310 [Dallia pectoralis]